MIYNAWLRIKLTLLKSTLMININQDTGQLNDATDTDTYDIWRANKQK